MTQHQGGHAARHDDAGPLHVEHAGAGPDVVLIHAGVADSRMWEPQWAAWQTRFALTRLDLRGFGRSGLSLGPFSHAADVLGVLDAGAIEHALARGRIVRRTRRARPRRRAPRARRGARARRPAAPGHPVVGGDARVLRGRGGGARGRRPRGCDRRERRVLAAHRERARACGDPRAAAQRLPAPDGRAGRLAPHRGPARRPADARRGDPRRHGRARQGRLPGDRRPPRRRRCRMRSASSSQAPATCRASSGRQTSTRSCSRSSRAVREEHAYGRAARLLGGRSGSGGLSDRLPEVRRRARPAVGIQRKPRHTPTRFHPVAS